jgi:hypothetical protein
MGIFQCSLLGRKGVLKIAYFSREKLKFAMLPL